VRAPQYFRAGVVLGTLLLGGRRPDGAASTPDGASLALDDLIAARGAPDGGCGFPAARLVARLRVLADGGGALHVAATNPAALARVLGALGECAGPATATCDCARCAALNRPDARGRTPLHLAGETASLAAALALLDAGARATVVDCAGRTPLHALADADADAAESVGLEKVVDALRMRGASALARDAAGATPLHLAAVRRGGARVLRALVATQFDDDGGGGASDSADFIALSASDVTVSSGHSSAVLLDPSPSVWESNVQPGMVGGHVGAENWATITIELRAGARFSRLDLRGPVMCDSYFPEVGHEQK